MTYTKVILSNIEESDLARMIAKGLHNYASKKYKSHQFSFWTTMSSGQTAIYIKSDQKAIDDLTDAFFTGFASCLYEQFKHYC